MIRLHDAVSRNHVLRTPTTPYRGCRDGNSIHPTGRFKRGFGSVRRHAIRVDERDTSYLRSNLRGKAMNLRHMLKDWGACPACLTNGRSDIHMLGLSAISFTANISTNVYRSFMSLDGGMSLKRLQAVYNQLTAGHIVRSLTSQLIRLSTDCWLQHMRHRGIMR